MERSKPSRLALRYYSLIVVIIILASSSVKWMFRSPNVSDQTKEEKRTENRDFTYLGSFSSSPATLSKSLVVRRAYFDHRKRQGHDNAVVFMLDMKRSLRSNMFVGCRVGQINSSKIRFRHSIAYKWAIYNIHVTQNVAFVDCFDISGVNDGDSAFLTISQYNFETSEVESQLEVRSQRNLIVPRSRKDLKHSHPSVMACLSTVRNGQVPPSEDGVLYHWLHYQKAIGVDHVHMIAEDTFVTTGGFDHPIIRDALKEKFLSIDFWPRWFNTTEIFYSSQHLASTDCVYRFQGVYDYIIIADSDDFFVPRGKSKFIKPYLKKWCSGKRASCNFQWYQLYPDCGWSPESVGPDGNLTATVHSQKMNKIKNTKSAHQICALEEVGRHTAMSFLPGYQHRSLVPFKEAYFAHVRKGKIPPNGC